MNQNPLCSRTAGALAALVLVLFAVPSAALPVQFGFLGGIGIAKLRGPSSPLVEFKSLKAAAYGVTLRVPVGPALALEPEVLVVTDGLSYGESDEVDGVGHVTGTTEFLHVLDRVQVPVLLRLTPPVPFALRPFAFAGPWVAVRLREYQRVTGSTRLTASSRDLAAGDFGATFGGGVQAKLGPGRAELQARYDLGLGDLGDYLTTGSAHTGALRVMAGWSF